MQDGSFLCLTFFTISSIWSKKRATSPVLPTTLNFAVGRGKLRIYTLQTLFDLFLKFAPPEGYKECAVVCFV